MQIVRRVEELPKILEMFSDAKVLSWDTETSPREVASTVVDGVVTYTKEDDEHNKRHGLDPYLNCLRLVQISDGADTAIILCDDVPVVSLKCLQPLLDNALTVGVNLAFDSKMLLHHCDLQMKEMWDLGVGELLLTAGQFDGSEWFHVSSLKSLMHSYLGKEVDKDIREEFGRGLPITPEQLQYADGDVVDLPRIYEMQLENIKRHKLLTAANVEMTAINGDVEMELTGIHVDPEKWLALAADATKRKMELYDSIQMMLLPQHYKDLFGEYAALCRVVDPNSPKDLPKALRRVGLHIANTKEQTIQDTINNTDNPEHAVILESILDYREASKQETTYGEEWLRKYVNPVTKKVHTHYRGIGAVTLRSSSSEPNMQQIPSRGDNGAKYRRCFVVPEGSELAFVIADYSAAELRILAWCSQDPNMMAAFNSDEGKDIHSLTACLMFEYDYDEFLERLEGGDQVAKDQRGIGKVINFGTAYGMGVGKGAAQTKLPYNVFKDHLQRWREVAYPVAWKWLCEVGGNAKANLEVRGIAGHRRYFQKPNPNELSREDYKWALGRIERSGKNFPVQNGNAVWLKQTKALLPSRLHEYGARLCHQVHDEIVSVCHEMVAEEVAEVVKSTMEEAGQMWVGDKGHRKAVKVSAEVHVATDWSK